MSDENIERNVLARIRTLLALERNYLAEERTKLAKLRTGVALALMTPPIYIFSVSLQLNAPILVRISFLCFLAVITIGGIFIILKSRSELKKIRIERGNVKNHLKKIIKSSENASNLLGDCMFLDD